MTWRSSEGRRFAQLHESHASVRGAHGNDHLHPFTMDNVAVLEQIMGVLACASPGHRHVHLMLSSVGIFFSQVVVELAGNRQVVRRESDIRRERRRLGHG